MRTIEIKDYYSPDIDKVWDWVPKSLKDVNFLIEINIGPLEHKGSDIFSVQVISLEVLQELNCGFRARVDSRFGF
jgi:RNAse (barnase) inhibitor barstar